MAVKNEQATYQELHVSYPDESITETIYQFVYDDIIKKLIAAGVPAEQIAAIGENRRAAKSNFGKHRARDHPREDVTEHARRDHRDECERRAAPAHFCSPAMLPTRTLSPSDSAYPPEVITGSPTLTPSVT